MMLEYALASTSHRFGHHAVTAYSEACHSLRGRDFNDRMGRVRLDVTIQTVSCIENGRVMVASASWGSNYRKQHL